MCKRFSIQDEQLQNNTKESMGTIMFITHSYLVIGLIGLLLLPSQPAHAEWINTADLPNASVVASQAPDEAYYLCRLLCLAKQGGCF